VKIYWSLPKISLGNLLKICWAGFVDNLPELHRPQLRELYREFDQPQRRAFVDYQVSIRLCRPRVTLRPWKALAANECSYFLPAQCYASAGICDRNVSVRLSVTSRYCIKMKKASVMISSPPGSSTILVFWCQISSRHSKESPRAGASNKSGVGKFSHFLPLRINISKTVADRANVTIND